jgi:outer membrane protein TolC
LSILRPSSDDPHHAIRQAKETLGQRRLDLETARDQVVSNVTQAWGQLDAAKAQIESTTAQVNAAEIALNGVREEARVGSAPRSMCSMRSRIWSMHVWHS